MMDLSTRYLGLTLKNPLVPSASPLSNTVDSIRKLEDSGAGAVVLHSLFEEQIVLESSQLDHYLTYQTEAFAEALTWFPEHQSYRIGPEEYLHKIQKAKEVVGIPIIGSLNGLTTGGWISYARGIQEAGADALELNPYQVATQPGVESAQVEERILDVLRAVKEQVSIPVAIKISPFFSSLPNMAQRFADTGASGLVLFNRFFEPDLDIEQLNVVPVHTLTTSRELHLPLRWIAILFGRVPIDFAITSGVHNHVDVLKGLMAGASITQMASELLSNGLQRIGEIRDDLIRWMEQHEYESVTQMKGSMSQMHVGSPDTFERANYMRVLESWHPDPAGSLYRTALRESDS